MLGKISMIGHSLGGLVIRTAIKHLKRYKERFHTLITLGTPHWGYVHSKSRLLSVGMWFYDKMSKDQLLTQIRLADEKLIQNTFIYQLSEDKSISWFDNIYFVGSTQDS